MSESEWKVCRSLLEVGGTCHRSYSSFVDDDLESWTELDWIGLDWIGFEVIRRCDAKRHDTNTTRGSRHER
jgi:hypothetical protein